MKFLQLQVLAAILFVVWQVMLTLGIRGLEQLAWAPGYLPKDMILVGVLLPIPLFILLQVILAGSWFLSFCALSPRAKYWGYALAAQWVLLLAGPLIILVLPALAAGIWVASFTHLRYSAGQNNPGS